MTRFYRTNMVIRAMNQCNNISALFSVGELGQYETKIHTYMRNMIDQLIEPLKCFFGIEGHR